MPISPKLIFTMKPGLGEIQQYIYIFCNSLFTNQMALSFHINILTGYIFLQDQTKGIRSKGLHIKRSPSQKVYMYKSKGPQVKRSLSQKVPSQKAWAVKMSTKI